MLSRLWTEERRENTLPGLDRRFTLRHSSTAFCLVLAGAALYLTGCGPNCQSTCEKLYIESECNIQRPGRTTDELLQRCSNECEGALEQPGEIGDYDPYDNSGSGSSITLDNEMQAAVWMECVAESACEKIDDGYCAPVW